MGCVAKARCAELLRYLQDPQLVARFQRACGVRGTFTGGAHGAAAVSGAQQRSARSPGNGGGANGAANGEKMGHGARRRGQEVKRDECNNGVLNGTPYISTEAAAGSEDDAGVHRDFRSSENRNGSEMGGSAVKPLRRNSLTGDAGQEFLIEKKFFYYLFTFGTELGNELFYISFFPFLLWNMDAFVGRRLVVVWVWVMYLGQCTKDVFRWPRPASPPVVKVEMFYNSEYSMPSTHAMSGTAIPISLFLLTCGRWEYPFLLGLALALSWCVLVCVSRIYMGMHSVLDVIAGFLYSILIMVVFSPALDVLDTFNLTCHYAPILIVSLHVALGLFSFTLDTWSTSRGDTTQILGSGAGIAVGSHVNHRLALMPDPPASMLPLQPPSLGLGLVGLCLLRFVLGVLILFGIRSVMKALTIPLVCRFFKIPSGDIQKARQHMEVELPYRYIVYFTVGFSAAFIVPFTFSCIGLS